jgi:hypothetical protein
VQGGYSAKSPKRFRSSGGRAIDPKSARTVGSTFVRSPIGDLVRKKFQKILATGSRDMRDAISRRRVRSRVGHRRVSGGQVARVIGDLATRSLEYWELGFAIPRS